MDPDGTVRLVGAILRATVVGKSDTRVLRAKLDENTCRKAAHAV